MAILFITVPIENNELLRALGARQVLPKKAKSTNPDSRIQPGCLMRADNTALATRSIPRFQERDEPTDPTRGVGTFPRKQRPRPVSPGRSLCPDLQPRRLSRRPLPSAPLLLLLQKRQVPLKREVESGGLAQPPVAAAPAPC